MPTALTSPGRNSTLRIRRKYRSLLSDSAAWKLWSLLGISETEEEKRQLRSMVTAVTKLHVPKSPRASEITDHPNIRLTGFAGDGEMTCVRRRESPERSRLGLLPNGLGITLEVNV